MLKCIIWMVTKTLKIAKITCQCHLTSFFSENFLKNRTCKFSAKYWPTLILKFLMEIIGKCKSNTKTKNRDMANFEHIFAHEFGISTDIELKVWGEGAIHEYQSNEAEIFLFRWILHFLIIRWCWLVEFDSVLCSLYCCTRYVMSFSGIFLKSLLILHLCAVCGYKNHLKL